MQQRSKQSEVQNPKRRAFLTLGLTGAAAFILGKVFGDDLARLFGGEESTKSTIGNFSVSETSDEMVFKDRSGEAIFIVDKASFRE